MCSKGWNGKYGRKEGNIAIGWGKPHLSLFPGSLSNTIIREFKKTLGAFVKGTAKKKSGFSMRNKLAGKEFREFSTDTCTQGRN